jgi:hypothetical protein
MLRIPPALRSNSSRILSQSGKGKLEALMEDFSRLAKGIMPLKLTVKKICDYGISKPR